MNVFWRPEPLNEEERELLDLCLKAHAESALRDNISTVMVKCAASGSGDYAKAISAALCGIGGTHAPLLDTWRVLNSPFETIENAIKAGIKIPGWGSTFSKKEIDPIWDGFVECLRKHFGEINTKIGTVSAFLSTHGKNIAPNPSCFTAATAMALRMPPQILPWLFIQGRLNTWTMTFMETLNPTKEAA